jgi:hypothetical protein
VISAGRWTTWAGVNEKKLKVSEADCNRRAAHQYKRKSRRLRGFGIQTNAAPTNCHGLPLGAVAVFS